jgi:hypothetical protein
MLPWAGKEVLIKAVAQAIPTIAMGCFKLIKGLCSQISSMICWWDQQDGKRKIHLLSEERMILPKKGGGLGFRDIYTFQLGHVSETKLWRLIQNPYSLCARILKAKYYPTSNCLAARSKSGW